MNDAKFSKVTYGLSNNEKADADQGSNRVNIIAKSFNFIAFQLLMCLQLFACWLHVTRQSHLNLVHCLATIWNGPFA